MAELICLDEQGQDTFISIIHRAVASLQACHILNIEIVPNIKCGPIRAEENSVPAFATEQRYGASTARKVPFYYFIEQSARFLTGLASGLQ